MSALFSPCDWVGSERFCRPCFRLAIGAKMWSLTYGLQSLFIFVVLDVWGWVVAVFAGLGLDRFQFGCFAGVA
jgi:hypothetical protein